ncbi:hypothetical protein FACS189450_10000 [Spirochaetia bacterium]|nr:hypothetical protein FACS189450_10000 [Spirochaetia bacterium]
MANQSAPDDKTGNIPWHPAFFEAVQMELAAFCDVLEFKYEYQLTTDPLRIDTLIIKKPKHVTIDKNFAQMFRSENICEYKSPGDYLIVESKKLSESDNMWLKGLNKGLDISGFGRIVKESRMKGKEARIGSYLYAVMQANPETLKEVTMSDLTVEDVLREAGYIPRWLETGRKEGRKEGREEGREEVARNLLNMGLSIEQIAIAAELDIETVKSLQAAALQ